jgi:hypothetical protein
VVGSVRTAGVVVRCLAFGISALAATLPAAAQQRPGGDDQAILQQACAGDYIQFCNGMDPAGREVEACFERNLTKFSPMCQQAIGSFKQRNPGGARPRS